MMVDTSALQRTLYEAGEILERARLITAGAPFFMSAVGDFATIAIGGDTATLSWPEVEGGYYDSYSMETQSVSFPSALLLMSVDEITAWKIDQRKKYDTEEKAKRQRETREHAERQTALELQTLAALQAKYGRCRTT